MLFKLVTQFKKQPAWQRIRQSQQAQELLLSLAAILFLILFGTLGYILIEEWNLFDSLYMTIMTMTTVGYGEVHPLSFYGRIFTIILMLLGVGLAMLVLTTTARVLLERQLYWISEGRAMQKAIDSLTGHTIFCGYSRLSRIAIQQVSDADMPLVIIDNNEDRVKSAEAAGYLAIFGDAIDEEVLIKAGIKSASRLVTLLPKDAENLYIVLSCKELNSSAYIISRAEEEVGEKRMLRAGVNRLISPYRVGGQKIADGVLRPHVTEFLDVAAAGGQSDLVIEEILIPIDSPLSGQTLVESGLNVTYLPLPVVDFYE